mgnify:FL=1
MIQNLKKIKPLLFIITFLLLSCKEEKYEFQVTNEPLAKCIDGYATFIKDGIEYSYPCNDYDLIGYVSLEEMDATLGNDCWGWTDLQTAKEYVLMGLENGTAIIDISQPTKPNYLGKIPTATVNSMWRDIKVYNNHAFIVSEANDHGMQVFDLKQLRGINTKQKFVPDYIYNGFGDAHNIAINTESGYAYTCGAGNSKNPVGIHALNIKEPTNPKLELQISDFGYSHDAQIVNYKGPDLDYLGKEIYVGSNETKVIFVDVSDKRDPKLISEFFYDDEYTHQSWLTEDHRYALLGDEYDELNSSYELVNNTRTIIIDISDLDNPVLHYEYLAETESIDHNGYVKGNNYYLSSYTSGLRVINIQNIKNKSLIETGFFDTHIDNDHKQNTFRYGQIKNNDPGDHTGNKGQGIEAFNGAWSVYPFFDSENIIISDINSGVFIVKKSSL